jgi:hypothetical protein
MKLKTTPVFEERANKSKQVTPNNNEDQRKRPSKLRVKQKTNLKARIEACEDDRDSTPTPTDQSRYFFYKYVNIQYKPGL